MDPAQHQQLCIILDADVAAAEAAAAAADAAMRLLVASAIDYLQFSCNHSLFLPLPDMPMYRVDQKRELITLR